MLWWEIVRGATESLRAYRLRSSLTVSSVAIGVFAIMVAGTATDSLNSTVFESLDRMGENTFLISRMPPLRVNGSQWRHYLQRPPITYDHGLQLKRALEHLTPWVCIYGVQPRVARVQWGNRSTDPDVSVAGVNEAFFAVFDVELARGRPILEQDLALNRPVAVLGADVAAELFGEASPVGEQVRIGKHRFEVVGVAKPRGSLFGESRDNFVVVPITFFIRSVTSERWGSLVLFITAPSREAFPSTMHEAIGAFRRIRGLRPWEPNDFEVETNQGIREQFAGLTRYIAFFGLGTGVMALVVAGVGIMNIMLVAVRERTREIGIRKALGARRRWIWGQFLAEALVLSLLGGVLGIGLGILVGWGLGSLIGAQAAIPWGWSVLSLAICLGTGIVWGTYPAWRAAGLDPVEALRYE